VVMRRGCWYYSLIEYVSISSPNILFCQFESLVCLSHGANCILWNKALWNWLVAFTDGLEFISPDLTQIGWPTSLPTSEKGSFIKSVFREKVIVYFIKH
jgi:hypothetical protein